MSDLIGLLRKRAADHGGDKLLEEAAAALEAAREDACVALVADIRFACGDNGKRMQPELVEFIRGLAADADRFRAAPAGWVSGADMESAMQTVVMDTWPGSVRCGHDARVRIVPEQADAAIDQARGKGGCGEGVGS